MSMDELVEPGENEFGQLAPSYPARVEYGAAHLQPNQKVRIPNLEPIEVRIGQSTQCC